MGELEEIGRRGWSGKSQLLTGWLCDGWVLVLVVLVLGYLDSDWSSAMAVLYSDSVYFFKILSFGILNSSIFFIAVMLACLVAFFTAFFEYCSITSHIF